MSCARPELNQRLVELLDGDVPELRAHAAECADCGNELMQMQEAFGALASYKVQPPSEAALERAHKAARPRALAPVAVAGVAAAALLTYLMHVHNPEQWAAWVTAGLSALAWALGVRAAEKGRTADPAFWAVTLLGAAFAVVSQPVGAGGGAACLGLALMGATGPFVVAAAGLSRGGVVLGASAGLLGLAAIRLHCPGGGLSHALTEHLPVLVVFVAAGALLGRIRLWISART